MKQGSLQLLTPAGSLAVSTPAPVSTLSSILDPDLTREEVLERIDPNTLKTAPLNLLVATAIALAPPDACAATEDNVLRYSEALTRDEAGYAYVKLTAEKLVLADVEYQAAIAAYQTAEGKEPLQSDWKSPQHYLEACKVHERRMDRHLRSRREAFERYTQAAEVYRTAMLTHQGLLAVLQNVAQPARRKAPVLTAQGGHVEVLPADHDEGSQGTTTNIMVVVR